ncbi:MAG: ABC transporter substrate-binding protein [Alphaproteobacteria bacterium]|nr:ABC transporter substrate-binding protein [Alphaproteobacteria bacterium]
MFDRRWLLAALAVGTMAAALPGQARAAAENIGVLRLGVLGFGTVNWELDVIKTHGLDEERSFTLAVEGFAGGQATKVALQGDAVDGIVSDWLWVSRQRAEGENYVFVPYSHTVGALMTPPDSDIQSLEDLSGKKIGVAGGALDKSWLLIQAAAKERHGMDLANEVEAIFGAPPLLNEKIETGELDAVLNFWHFCARLEAKGYNRLLGVDDAIQELGVGSNVPQLGYVFPEAFANENADLIEAFADASRAAKALLQTDEEWERIRELTKAKDDVTLEALKTRFQEGIPLSWGEIERADAAQLYELLAKLGGEELVGPSPTLVDGTFWSNVAY